MPVETPDTGVMRRRTAAPSDAVRPTRAEVNLEALRHNLRVLERHAGTSQVWAVLKADAYGHGAPAVARTLERAGAKGFCVALLEEGVEQLRASVAHADEAQSDALVGAERAGGRRGKGQRGGGGGGREGATRDRYGVHDGPNE